MKQNNPDKVIDIVAVGLGPFNLSLAALLNNASLMDYQFLEAQSDFTWHNDMMLDDTQMQTHYLKDLVTCVDPLNPYSFIAYLHDQKRIYEFLNCKKSSVSRMEYYDYFRWAARKMNGITFGVSVDRVEHNDDYFRVQNSHGRIDSQHLVVGVGQKPNIPNLAQKYIGTKVFHNSVFKTRLKQLNIKGKNILIVGGGQSGAEIFHYLMTCDNKPHNVTWASRRFNFSPLEDSCFSNEIYTPPFIKYFYHLSSNERQAILPKLKLTSDGITEDLLNKIFNTLYDIKYVRNEPSLFNLLTDVTLQAINPSGNGYDVKLKNKARAREQHYSADIIILATGYRPQVPLFLRELLQSDELIVNEDYSLAWQHGATNKIYVQNLAKNSHGVADPNLSLAAWRNAVIINSILGYEHYQTQTAESILDYSLTSLPQRSK